ncbi:MAG: hypothetical protein GY800_09500 [Planctomycetes bacterium]|nr:hypothetical protein [Planctomycetota bacterium]
MSMFLSGVCFAEASSAPEAPAEGLKLEELEPEPLGDLFAIKLLEKIIELEDALKYLASEVGEMNDRLTKKMDNLEKRVAKLEKAPPGYASGSGSGKPSAPKPPPKKRFEVGDVYLGNGFYGHAVVYESTDEGTNFSGEIENKSPAPTEKTEFEIVAYDENGKIIGAKSFKVEDLEVGESTPFEAHMKGPQAHWIKKHEMAFLRGS